MKKSDCPQQMLIALGLAPKPLPYDMESSILAAGLFAAMFGFKLSRRLSKR